LGPRRGRVHGRGGEQEEERALTRQWGRRAAAAAVAAAAADHFVGGQAGDALEAVDVLGVDAAQRAPLVEHLEEAVYKYIYIYIYILIICMIVYIIMYNSGCRRGAARPARGEHLEEAVARRGAEAAVGPDLARERGEGLRVLPEEVEGEDALRGGEVVLLQVGVEARARAAEVGDACTDAARSGGRLIGKAHGTFFIKDQPMWIGRRRSRRRRFCTSRCPGLCRSGPVLEAAPQTRLGALPEKASRHRCEVRRWLRVPQQGSQGSLLWLGRTFAGILSTWSRNLGMLSKVPARFLVLKPRVFLDCYPLHRFDRSYFQLLRLL
jgi:hypothetical protein